MKNTKFSYFCLTIILILSVFIAACSSDQEEATGQENNESSENFNAEGFPIVNEPITVSIMGAKHALVGDWEKLQFFEEMEKLTNIQFEFNEVPVTDYEERKNLAFASGEIPELFFGARLTADDEMRYGEQGILIPLEDLIEKYAPNIQKVFDENPELKKSVTAPDGHIYALPQYNEAPIAHVQPMWINGHWLKNLGITELPKTTEDLYELLKIFKENDPNQNGEADEIPLTSVGMDEFRNSILPAFGILGRDHVLKDGKIVFGAIQPEYKEYVEYMNRLWEEGLIDNSSYSQTIEQKTAKGNNGQVGMFMNALPYLTLGDNEPIHPVMPALTSKEGREPAYVRNTGIQRGTFAITNKAKNPEALIRWADYFYTAEGETLLHYGLEGHLWEWADKENGLRTYIEQDGMNTEEYRGGVITPAVGTSVPMYTTADIEAGWDDEVQLFRIKEVDEKLAPYGQVPYPLVYLTPEEKNEIVGMETDVHTYIATMEAKFITGETSIDDEWDNYVKTIEGMGIDKLIEIYQKAYDRWEGA